MAIFAWKRFFFFKKKGSITISLIEHQFMDQSFYSVKLFNRTFATLQNRLITEPHLFTTPGERLSNYHNLIQLSVLYYHLILHILFTSYLGRVVQ